MKKILIIDPDESHRNSLIAYLEKEGYETKGISNGAKGLETFINENWDLVILEIDIPGLDGWYLCEEIRNISSVPIIIITERGSSSDRILGLELGADDYLVKPVSPREVILRIRSIRRRLEGSFKQIPLGGMERVGDIQLCPNQHKVWVRGREVKVTNKEFDILSYFMKNCGRVVTREQLIEEVWGIDFDGNPRSIDSYIHTLREKLSENTGQQVIKTVWGIGYILEKCQ
ncbi:response regulator transcription factor [Microaerobacter geothermalis]|uniref:response regulator transcription factor n=1 Tax=Microaerobacter geothermalis TaxID=674972 RepID=UPI001F4812B9|nr:response regulator transcription factor [Microaerobacter geothermalis]MCF6094398.1 response regulator transcription factor [Microaerobacter geothermalis]